MDAAAIVLAAAIAASPAIYTAFKSRKIDKKTDTSNGHTIGHMVEEHAKRIEILGLKLDHHIRDSAAHHSASDVEKR